MALLVNRPDLDSQWFMAMNEEQRAKYLALHEWKNETFDKIYREFMEGLEYIPSKKELEQEMARALKAFKITGDRVFKQSADAYAHDIVNYSISDNRREVLNQIYNNKCKQWHDHSNQVPAYREYVSTLEQQTRALLEECQKAGTLAQSVEPVLSADSVVEYFETAHS